MSSYIRIMNACLNAPPVDVYANDKIIARGLAYRDFTEYIPVQTGTYNIKVYPSGSKGVPVVDTSLSIPAKSILTVAAIGKLAIIELLPFADQPAVLYPDKVSIKFVNLLPDAPSVDVNLADDTVLFRNVPYKGITDYTTVNPATYTLQLRLADTKNVVLTVPNQKFSGGRAYTAYAVGLISGYPPQQLLTPLDGSSYLKIDSSDSGQTVIDSVQADVNGDGVLDKVFLKGNKPDPESPFVDNITLCVEDGKTGKTVCETPSSNAGYNANLFIADFTKDNIPDILVRIESGGSGGYLFAYVYSAVGNSLVKLFDYEEFNAKSQFNVVFKDNYKVEVISRNTNEKYIIDLSGRKEEYSDIYDKNGRLIKPVQGSVLGMGGLEPANVDNDASLELIATQRIIGRFNADTLGYVKTTLDWNGVRFVPVEINYFPL